MTGETPGGGGIHTGGSEGGEAQSVLVGGDGLSNFLQGGEILDVVSSEAGLLHQSGVDDDAVALIAVADGAQLAVLIIDVVSVGVQLVVDGGALQVQAVVGPVLGSSGVTHDEDGGSLFLVHLGGQGGVVLTGSGGNDLDLHTGLLGVQLGDLGQDFLGLGLEVQPVHGTLSSSLAPQATRDRAMTRARIIARNFFMIWFTPS